MTVIDSFKNISPTLARKYLQDGIIDVEICNHLKQTALFFAVQNVEHATELTRMLIQCKADPDHEDARGQTATFYLATTDGTQCLEFLLSQDIDLDHKDANGQSALFFAAAHGQNEMIRALCNAGAKVNLKDNVGQTALFWVSDATPAVNALFDMGANFNVRCKGQKDILEKARSLERYLPAHAARLRAYHTLYNLKGKCAWRVWKDGSFEVVMLAAPKDVDQLCVLECEFVEDHREILKSANLTEQDLFREIGLNPDPLKRREVIQSIVNTKQQRLVALRGGYTLKTAFYPSRNHGQEAKPEVIAYVYFKLKDVLDSLMVPVDPTASPVDEVPKIVVSHLKVGRAHQGKGVAKLILSGMLRFTEQSLAHANSLHLMTRRIQEMQLSVVDPNKRAIGLYESLGFRKVSNYINGHDECLWHTMVSDVDEDVEETIRGWMKKAMDGGEAHYGEETMCGVQAIHVTSKTPPMTRKRKRGQ